MKSITLVLTLILLASCNTKSEGTLTAEERANLQQRYNTQCLSNSSAAFSNIKYLSDRQFTPSDTFYFVKGQSWTVTQKSGTTTTLKEIYTVWKVAPDTVYFIITITDISGATSYNFLKVDSTNNSEMIDTLQAQKCKNEPKFSVSNTTGSATVNKETDTFVSTDRYDRRNVTSQIDFNYITLFGSFNDSVTTKQVTSAGDTHSDSTTTTLTKSFVRADADVTTMPGSYTGYTPGITQFCTISYTAGSPNVYTYPFARTCQSNPATTTLQGWTNPGGDL